MVSETAFIAVTIFPASGRVAAKRRRRVAGDHRDAQRASRFCAKEDRAVYANSWIGARGARSSINFFNVRNPSKVSNLTPADIDHDYKDSIWAKYQKQI